MATIEELKQASEDAEKKVVEVVKDCRDAEGGSIGLALFSSAATEASMALGDMSKAPKNVISEIGVVLVHLGRWVTHGQTLNEISKSLQPSCKEQFEESVNKLKDTCENWQKKEADVVKMKSDYEDYMKLIGASRNDLWGNFQKNLDQYDKQIKETHQAFKRYSEACGKVTIYSAPVGRVYSKDAFENIWAKGKNELKSYIKSS